MKRLLNIKIKVRETDNPNYKSVNKLTMVDLPIKVMLKVSILQYKYILTLHVQHIDVQAKQQTITHLCSLKTEFSRTIFSSNSMSSFGKSAVMKALTVTDMSSGSWVSDNAVCTTCQG